MSPQMCIDVIHDEVDGYHIFTSNNVKGLYVMSRDVAKAFNAVPSALKTILAYNLRGKIKPEEIEVSSSISIEDFLEYIGKSGLSNPIAGMRKAKPPFEIRFSECVAA